MMFSNHALLRILAKRGQAQISAIAAKYGITQLMSSIQSRQEAGF